MIADTLKAVKELLGPNGEHWCKGALARGKSGRSVDPSGRAAVRWCIAGAFCRDGSLNSLQRNAAKRWLQRWMEPVPRVKICYFNDTREWPEVSALLDRAIAEAESQGI